MKGGLRCSCCGQTTGPFAIGRILKVARVDGQLRPMAWVTCRRPIPGGDLKLTCGWGWWSRDPTTVARAKRRPGMKLVRARQGRDLPRQAQKGGRPRVR